MAIEVFKKEEQAYGEFNSGQIIENKPIGFPSDGGILKPYSNLFYWAHAISNQESTIGLHPHQGFEIMSIVLEGKIEHFDTKLKKWLSLEKGDVQLIQAGSGISHSEKLLCGARIFQIWFDPNLAQSLEEEAQYFDCKYASFEKEHTETNTSYTIVGKNGKLNMKSEGVEILSVEFEGRFNKELASDKYCSIYVCEGNGLLNGRKINQHDFVKIDGETDLKIEGNEMKLYLIQNPKELSYRTYASRRAR